MAKKPSYKVLSPVVDKKTSKRTEPGGFINLSEEDAKILIAKGVIEEVADGADSERNKLEEL